MIFWIIFFDIFGAIITTHLISSIILQLHLPMIWNRWRFLIYLLLSWLYGWFLHLLDLLLHLLIIDFNLSRLPHHSLLITLLMVCKLPLLCILYLLFWIFNVFKIFCIIFNIYSLFTILELFSILILFTPYFWKLN